MDPPSSPPVCNITEQMKVGLIFIHSIAQVSTSHITEYMNKHDACFVDTVMICNKV